MNIYRRLEIINSKSVNNKNKVKENDNMAQVISSEEFNNLVQNTEGIAVVDFFATWCGPCKMLGPVLEEVASERSEIQIVKIDVDENTSLAKTYGIMSVPTMILFKDGKPISKKSGYMPKELIEEWMNENK